LTERSSITVLTDLGIAKELENRDFRNQFFRSEREIDIPNQIKNLRKLRDMNQAHLAELVGTKQSAISRLERSQEAKWELETLVKVAEALDARLSVVIEPYEIVVARYRAERNYHQVSAAAAVGDIRQYISPQSARTAASGRPETNKTSASHAASSYRQQPDYLSDADEQAQRSALSS
jgi:transcriptional regulator with XRE-family HTH domain